jgi:hypothetical protein
MPASSPYGQTLDAQFDQLRGVGRTKTYREKVSGAGCPGRELLKLLKVVTPDGDAARPPVAEEAPYDRKAEYRRIAGRPGTHRSAEIGPRPYYGAAGGDARPKI